MLTPLQQAKMRRRFLMLDVDGDGLIRKQDLDLLVERICERLRPERHAAEEEVIRDGYENYWTYLIANCDLDSDGRISLAEYLTAVEGGLLSDLGQYESSLGRALPALFHTLDSNDDGRINQSEFAPLGETFGVGPQDVSMIFTMLDADGDGEVSLDEFLVAARDFYVGDDPSSAGGVFGRGG